MFPFLRLLAEERPVDLLLVGAAHSGAGGVWFSLHIQTGFSEKVLQEPTAQVKRLPKFLRKSSINVK